MNDAVKKLGDICLLELRLPTPWVKKNLWKTLMDTKGAMENPFNTASYSRFFMKIRGEYDPAIIPVEFHCKACPYNFTSRRYHDFNELREEKEAVLVLVSNTFDFREYDIMCSYFTDKLEMKDAPNIELWGERATISNWFSRKFGFRP